MTKNNLNPLVPKRQPDRQAEVDTLFASMGEGVITTDAFGKISRVNPVAQRILGYTEEELLGEWFPKKIVAFSMSGERMSVMSRPITRIFISGKPVSEKLYYLNKSGERIPISITASPILVKNKPVGAIGVFRDITLEQEVDRMKSEFISLASHQLRTPLSAIKTYTHMLAEGYMGALNRDQKASLQTIISASNRMNELISTLLNVTRIESGSISVVLKTVNLDSVIREVLPELLLMAEVKQISVSLETKESLRNRIRTDPLIVKEIITNLVGNAIKYTPKKGEVRIAIQPRSQDILIEIHDSGWGIPAASQDQIFSKFFRGQNIVKRETTGTGLGLYLVKSLIDILGGRIWFTSEETVGTSFFFTLPRNKRLKTATKFVDRIKQ